MARTLGSRTLVHTEEAHSRTTVHPADAYARTAHTSPHTLTLTLTLKR